MYVYVYVSVPFIVIKAVTVSKSSDGLQLLTPQSLIITKHGMNMGISVCMNCIEAKFWNLLVKGSFFMQC